MKWEKEMCGIFGNLGAKVSPPQSDSLVKMIGRCPAEEENNILQVKITRKIPKLVFK